MAMYAAHQPLERHICVCAHSPKEKDELALEEDDVVLVAQKFEDGWCWGISLRDHEVGAFPMCILKHQVAPILRNRHKDKEEELDERSSVIRTLYFSELGYKSQLGLLHHYVRGLELETSTLVVNLVSDLKKIEVLHDLSCELFIQLASRVAGWDNSLTLISNLFSKVMPDLKKMYKTYAEISPRVLDHLVKITENKALRGLIAGLEETCEVDKSSRVTQSMKKLSAIILSPLTHLCKYQQLIKLLSERTSDTHPDYISILAAAHDLEHLYKDTHITQNNSQNELKLKEIIGYFEDEQLMITEQKEEVVVPLKRRGSKRISQLFGTQKSAAAIEKICMKETLKQMTGDKLYGDFMSVFDQPHNRFYICEGNLKIKDAKVYFYLFDDLLLIAQLTKPKLKLMYRLNLTQSWITDLDAGEEMTNSFKIGSPEGVYTCVVQGDANQLKGVKEHWLKTINSRILDQKKKFERILSMFTVPTSMVYSVEATSKVAFLRVSEYELNLEEGDKIQVFCIYDRRFNQYRPGLHIGERYQDPSIQWYYGMLRSKQGWFPKGCVALPGSGVYTQGDVKSIKWNHIVQMKRGLLELSEVGLQEIEDKTVQVKYRSRIKEVTLPSSCTINDLIDLYFSDEEIPNKMSQWSLVEVSPDGSFKRKLNRDEDPANIVNFWGQGKEQMKFVIEEKINH